MASKIVPFFPVYHDTDGDTLDTGHIYVGVENLNPEINPINVFWDSELTIPAPQPIRTINGYPSRSGAAAAMYVSESQYSVTTRDKNNKLVNTVLSDRNPVTLALQSDNIKFARDYTDFETAVSTIGATVTTLYVTEIELTDNVVTPATLSLVFEGLGELSVNSGKTVTINGSVQAPLKQIFSGLGNVLGLDRAYAIWYGVLTSASGSVNTAALTSAFAGASVLTVTPGTYVCEGQPTVASATILFGYRALLNFTTDSDNQGLKLTAQNIAIIGIELVGPQFASFVQTQIGILAAGVDNDPSAPTFINNIIIKDVKISSWGSAGIQLFAVEKFKVFDNTIDDCHKYGVLSLSSKFGLINRNAITGIIADGVVGTNAYAITLTKNNGTATRYPTSKNISVIGNIIDDIRTWDAIDTHGGNHFIIANNIIKNSRGGIAVGSYFATAASEDGPNVVSVTGNVIERGSLVSAADAQRGILVAGYAASGARAVGITVSGNTMSGYGDGSVISGVGAIQIQYTESVSVTGNVMTDNGRQAIMIASSLNLKVGDNVVKSVSGAISAAATGTITIGTIPNAGDTITLNGSVWTYRASASLIREITIGGSINTTASNTATALDSGSGSGDGRISTATYSASANVVTVTANDIGRSMNKFNLATSSGGRITVSGNLIGGAIGSSGLDIRKLSSGSGDLSSSGVISDNVFDVGAAVAIQMEDDNKNLKFANNANLGTGPTYDLIGSSTTPQSGSGDIGEFFRGIFTSDLPSIAAGDSYTIYIPAAGMPISTVTISITLNRPLGGLVIETIPEHNYIQIVFENPTSGAINLAGATFIVKVDKIQISSIAIE